MTMELPAPLQRMLECATATVSAAVDVLSSVSGMKEWIEQDLLEVDDSGIPIVSIEELKCFAPKLRVLRNAVHLAQESFAAVEFDLYLVEGDASPTAEAIEFASKLYTTLFGYGSGLRRSLPDNDEELVAKLVSSFPHSWLRVKEMRLDARSTNQRIRKEIARAAHLGRDSQLSQRHTPETEKPKQRDATDETQKLVKRPKSKAFESFKLHFVMSPQSAIAEVVYNDRKKQWQVSRDIKAVTEFLQSCGLAKEEWQETSQKPEFVSWSPSEIDLGKRQDGRTERQRENFEENG